MRYGYSAFSLLLLLILSLTGRAQQAPSISQTDLPNVSDTLRLSQTTTALGPALTQTGPNQTWNYAGLRPGSQRVASFQSVATTPGLLPLAFGAFAGANRATLAQRQDLGPLAGAGLPVSEVYLFFAKTATDYRQVGFGAVLQGVALPVTYQSAQLQDVVYRLPLRYEQKDSSNSEFIANVPQLAYLRQKQKRVNHVDGWGTLTTPFGTFPALRVVSTLTTRDSVSVQGQAGTVISRVTREYKWLGNNQGVPLLHITTQVLAGREVVTLVEYRDVYRRLAGPLATTELQPDPLGRAYPNPLPAGAALHLPLPPAPTGPVHVSLTDVTGRELFRQRVPAAVRTLVVPAEALGSFRGVGLLRVHTAAGVRVQRLVRE